MERLVVHPLSSNTQFFRYLYPDGKTTADITEHNTKAEVIRELTSAKNVLIMGEGDKNGLLCWDRDSEFGRYLVHRDHWVSLSLCNSIIGIWDNANIYARDNGLHGLFSGTLITDISSAYDWGVPISKEDLDYENERLAFILGKLINDPKVKLNNIPAVLSAMATPGSFIQEFNYNNFLWL